MSTAQKIIKYLALAFAIFIIVNIISGILFGIYSVANIFGLTKSNTNKIISNEKVVTNFENVNLATLKIKLEYSTLVIRQGDTLKVESNSKDISCKQNNNQLEIKENSHNWSFKNDESIVNVYLPSNIVFDDVKIEVGAGEINIEKLETKNLDFELGAGKAEIKQLNVTEIAKINGGAGKVDIISGEIHNLDLDMGVGKFELTSKLTGKNDIDAGVGKLDINLTDGTENYKIKVSKGIGSITIDGKNASDNTEYGDGKTFIKIDGGVGSINVK